MSASIQLRKATLAQVKHACMNYHYAKRMPPPEVAFSCYEDKRFVGVIIYGNPSIPNIAESYNLTNGQVYELRRVALNGNQALPASKYVAISLKLLKKRKPLVKIIVSYADTAQNHTGTIYRATNWLYLGLMKGSKELKHKQTGKVIHSKSLHNKDRNDYAYIATGDKHKYVYTFDKSLRRELESKAVSFQDIEGGAVPTSTLQ